MKVPQYGILTHGGIGSDDCYSDGCEKANNWAMKLLDSGEDAFVAALSAIQVLEDDGRFNAGSGSAQRLDGKTVQMDASIIDSSGRFGAVACISRVKNPILVAALLAETSDHHFLAGAGAIRYARKHGFPKFAASAQSIDERYQRMRQSIEPDRWNRIKRDWNFSSAIPPLTTAPTSCDTVGAVALDKNGTFAAALSTGGSGAMLNGRVGDVPVIGAGLYAGPKGAVALTGRGEFIMRNLLAYKIYRHIESGMPPKAAFQKEIATLVNATENKIPLGAIAITLTDCAVYANRSMAHSMSVKS